MAVLLLLLFCGGILVANAQNTSSCYFCQETDEVCRDPVNVAILPSVRCSELSFSNARSTQVKETGLAGQINQIMIKDVEPRSRATGDRIFECLKVAVTITSDSNSTSEGVLRTCVIKAEDVSSSCDFLQEELPSNYTLNYCGVCDGDKCNGSAHLGVSTLLGVVLLSLTGRFLQ